MPNQKPEQDLIDGFVEIISKYDCFEPHNSKCRSRQFADIECTLSGQRWAIEAKSHKSKDQYNTVHKLFGELLKETRRQNRTNCNISILIPNDGIDFYHNHFREIDRCKFLGFGRLIPIHTVFSYDHDNNSVEYTSWKNFYDNGFSVCTSGFPIIRTNPK